MPNRGAWRSRLPRARLANRPASTSPTATVRAPGERIAARRFVAIRERLRQNVTSRNARAPELGPWLDLAVAVAVAGARLVGFVGNVTGPPPFMVFGDNDRAIGLAVGGRRCPALSSARSRRYPPRRSSGRRSAPWCRRWLEAAGNRPGRHHEGVVVVGLKIRLCRSESFLERYIQPFSACCEHFPKHRSNDAHLEHLARTEPREDIP